MKLSETRQESSFYESFSDLIFGTLVVFIVIVMGLAIQLKQATSNMQAEMKRLIYPNRFSGGAGSTTYYISYIPIGGENHVLWFPAWLGARWGLTRHEVSEHPGLLNDPVKELCRLALEPDGITATPVRELLKMGSGTNFEFVAGSYVMMEWGEAIMRIFAVRDRDPQAFARMSPEELKQRIGGLHLGEKGEQVEEVVANGIRAFWRWAGAAEGTPYKRMYEGDVELATRLAGTQVAGEPALIRFRVEAPGRVRVGDAVMRSVEFRNLLRSIRPGKGFRVEYIGSGSDEEEPPRWVFDEILAPIGFDGRIINPLGLKVLSGATKTP